MDKIPAATQLHAPVNEEINISEVAANQKTVYLRFYSESRERVRSSIKNCGMDFPVSRITVNLAPADIRKEGPLYDLPILIALLSASRQITTELSDSAFLGELSLGGGVRRVTGVLPMLLEAKQRGLRRVFIPEAMRRRALRSAAFASILYRMFPS